MMASFDNVLTDPRLTAPLVREALATSGTDPRPLLDEYLCMASGGSSGRRGNFVYDVDALADLLATLMRRTLARMPDGLPTSGLTIAMVGASSAVHGTGLISHLLDRGPVRFVPVPATLPLHELVERLDRLRVRWCSPTRACWRCSPGSNGPGDWRSSRTRSPRTARPCCPNTGPRSRTPSTHRSSTCTAAAKGCSAAAARTGQP